MVKDLALSPPWCKFNLRSQELPHAMGVTKKKKKKEEILKVRQPLNFSTKLFSLNEDAKTFGVSSLTPALQVKRAGITFLLPIGLLTRRHIK